MERNLFKILVLFSVLASILAQGIELCEGIPDDIMIPVEDDCTSFYLCPEDDLESCPDDLYFSEAEQNCVLTNDHCFVATTTTITETDSPIHEDCKDIEATDEVFFFPSKTNCANYYFCYNGQPQEMTCITGMYWNQAELRCDWSDNVECLITATTEIPTTTATPEICPESDVPVFVPSTTACGEYYLCNKGTPQALKCAEDMHWNQETLQCDYPENVNCEIDALPKCPETGVHFYPHPEKCTQYISCYYGKRTIVNCPFNEIWDTVQNKCLSENLATCILD